MSNYLLLILATIGYYFEGSDLANEEKHGMFEF